jgi:hypothetical protein
MSEFAEDYEQTTRLLAEVRRLESELSQMTTERDQALISREQWIAKAKAAEADAGWWHATVANYVTSATVEDRTMMRGVLAEGLICPHPGAALLREIEAAQAHVAALLKWAPLPQYAINQEMSDAITAARAWLDAAKGDGE